MTETEYDEDCPSCDERFIEHLGLVGTCQLVQDLRAEVERLTAELASLPCTAMTHERCGDRDPQVDCPPCRARAKGAK